MRKKIFVLLLSGIFAVLSYGQEAVVFDRQDTLRGSITPEREWWDLNYYHLDFKVDPSDNSIKGLNTIGYTVMKSSSLMQIDLQPPMQIISVTGNDKNLDFERDGNVWYINVGKQDPVGQYREIAISFEGKPKMSKNPPWDGGVAWKKDINGIDFIANANQGDGASLWWPCKDHMYDEPDSMLISVRVPDPLINVSNGRLRGVDKHSDGTSTYHWFVSNPISNYCVNFNIGDYVHFSDTFPGEKGPLDCDYWVLKDNVGKAKEHFKQAHKMLEAFEYWFGPYPFYEDSYKLVEVPYPGMEHQSSVTYGNGYRNGYGGNDVSSTGYGLFFDFILVHESGHEWFANNITYKDQADGWIHESFIAYSESLYVDYFYGKEAGAAYCRGTRLNIGNREPIIGFYDVNHPGSGDRYSKGANMLHTMRQIINDDDKWRSILRGLNEEFYHQTVGTKQIEDYIIEKSGLDLQKMFDQYLRDTRIPTLEYALVNGQLRYRWANCIDGFNMPVKVFLDGNPKFLFPTRSWKRENSEMGIKKVEIDKDFYVAGIELNNYEMKASQK